MHVEENYRIFLRRSLVVSIMWGVAGSMSLSDRSRYSSRLSQIIEELNSVDLPPANANANKN